MPAIPGITTAGEQGPLINSSSFYASFNLDGSFPLRHAPLYFFFKSFKLKIFSPKNNLSYGNYSLSTYYYLMSLSVISKYYSY